MVFKLQFPTVPVPRSLQTYQVELELSETETSSEASSSSLSHIPTPNIFGIFRYYQKFSPFNCGLPRPFCYFTRTFTILSILSMLFRVYWMFWQTGTETLTFGWAESKLYGFLAFESFICTIAICRITWSGSLARFEQNLGKLQSLRVGPEKIHKRIDNYRILKIRVFCGSLFLFVSLTLAAVYLVAHKKFLWGEVKHSSWYWFIDPIIAILGAYSNLLFLPNHFLLHHAIAREFDVFNDELEEFSKARKLAIPSVMRQFGDRQVKLFEFTNFMTTRIANLMTWAPTFSLLALLMGTYIISRFDKSPETLYLISLISVTISCFIMSFTLLYPVAFVQESMSATAKILMTDSQIQNSNGPSVYNSYRIMLDRSLFNRTANCVLHVFDINRKNIERAFFFHSLVIVLMVVIYDFETGMEEGFGELAKFAKMLKPAAGGVPGL